MKTDNRTIPQIIDSMKFKMQITLIIGLFAIIAVNWILEEIHERRVDEIFEQYHRDMNRLHKN